MDMTNTALLALVVSAIAWADGKPTSDRVEFKEEAIAIEFTATSGEATVVFQAESEVAMQRLQIHDPLGRRLGTFDAGDGNGLRLSGYVLEAAEGTRDEILATFMQGTYAISGQTPSGRKGTGSAALKHRLLDAPAVLYPVEGATDVSTNLTVGWIPDPEAVSYRINLEQGDSDTLAVKLPAGTSSFDVPTGVLAAGESTHVEVGAVAPNGNCTLVEIHFTTR